MGGPKCKSTAIIVELYINYKILFLHGMPVDPHYFAIIVWYVQLAQIK